MENNKIVILDTHKCQFDLNTKQYEHVVHIPTHKNPVNGIHNFMIDLLQEIKLEVKDINNKLQKQTATLGFG